MGKVIRFDLIIHAVLQNNNEYIRVKLHQGLSQVNFFLSSLNVSTFSTYEQIPSNDIAYKKFIR